MLKVARQVRERWRGINTISTLSDKMRMGYDNPPQAKGNVERLCCCATSGMVLIKYYIELLDRISFEGRWLRADLIGQEGHRHEVG